MPRIRLPRGAAHNATDTSATPTSFDAPIKPTPCTNPPHLVKFNNSFVFKSNLCDWLDKEILAAHIWEISILGVWYLASAVRVVVHWDRGLILHHLGFCESGAVVKFPEDYKTSQCFDLGTGHLGRACGQTRPG